MVFSKQSEKQCIFGTFIHTKPDLCFMGKNLKMAQTPGRCKIWEAWFLWTFGQDHTKSG